MFMRDKMKSRMWEIYKYGSVRDIDVISIWCYDYNISTRRVIMNDNFWVQLLLCLHFVGCWESVAPADFRGRSNYDSYKYDRLGRLTQTIHNDGSVTKQLYDKNSYRVLFTIGNDVVTQYKYDKYNRLIGTSRYPKDKMNEKNVFEKNIIEKRTYDELGELKDVYKI